MNISIKGIEYQVVGSAETSLVRDADTGDCFAVIEEGEVWKDGDHIGYLANDKGIKFISMMPEWSYRPRYDVRNKTVTQIRRAVRIPPSGCARFFYESTGYLPEEYPKWYEEFKPWYKIYKWSQRKLEK
jgi:C4-dicarboxylate-specific signal transduction histidine kinase